MIMYRTGWQEATCVIFADTSEILLWGVFWADIPEVIGKDTCADMSENALVLTT